MSRLPIRRRLVLSTVLSLGLALAILVLVFNLVLATRLTRDADAVLRSRADAALATLTTEGGRLGVENAPGRTVLDQSAWVFAADRVVAQAPGPPGLHRAVRALATSISAPTTREPDPDTRLLAVPARGPDGRSRIGTVVVSVSRIPYERSERIALVGSLLLGALLLALTAVTAQRIAGVALQPVARMTRQAAEWSERDLDRRFGAGPARDELTALAATLDGLLDRLAASLRHEQRFSAEVAHELRTPLAGAQAAAELALRHDRPPDELREALRTVLRSTERMAAVVETLVSAAQAEAETGAQPGLGTSDALAGVRAATTAWDPLAAERDVDVVLVPPSAPVSVGVDEALLERIVAPVLDNAIRYGSSRVEVTIERRDRWATFLITDDGPGIGDGEADGIFEPGVRGSAAVGVRGAGLGLSLARRLARAAGGDAEVSGGGVLVRLPAAPRAYGS
jgi:two-component system OmpR family sensor kinase